MKSNFTPSLNVKIDYRESFSVITKHKAYLLLEANAGKPDFKYFMGNGQRIWNLGNEYVCYSDRIHLNWRYNCKKFKILEDRDCGDGKSHFQLCKTAEPYGSDAIPILENDLDNWFWREKTRIILQHAQKDFVATCRFFQQSDAPFGKFASKCGQYEQTPNFEHFTVTSDRLMPNNDWVIDYPGIRGDLSTPDNCLFRPLEFKNEFGNVTMKVVLAYFPQLGSFLAVPVTPWKNNSSANDLCGYLFAVPQPGKQPLLNLDRIVHEDTHIYLTPDLIFSNMNSDKTRICTSWLCDSLDCVDWQPLKDKDVTLLVHNYGGKSFENAVLEMHDLSQYLQSRNLIRSLDYQILDFDYGEMKPFATYSEIVDYHRSSNIKLMENGNFTANEPEFEKLCEKAAEKMNRMAIPIYADCSSELGDADGKKNTSSDFAIPDYVFHPILARGEQTILMAPIGLGKSSMALSIAAMIVNESQRCRSFFKEKNWSVPRGGMHKVLYLDFENGSMLRKKMNDFAKPYLPANHDDDAKSNLIVENCLDKVGTDFTSDEGRKVLWQMIAEAEKKGTPGRPVDVVVIDTLEKFIATDGPQTAIRLAQVVTELRSRNIAVLLVAHADEKGENIRGFKNKTDDAFRTVILNRKNRTGRETLATPFTVSIAKDRGSLPEVVKSFEGKFEDGEWKVHNPQYDQKSDLLVWCDYYQNQGLHRDQIANLLGMCKSKLQELIK